jgi:signal transduction histidine kinase
MILPQTSKQSNDILLNLDRSLLFLRWVAVGVAIPFSYLGEFEGGMWLPFPVAFGLIAGLNLLLTDFVIQRRVSAIEHSHVIIIADAVQAGLATLLAGGYHSMFIGLFVLLVVELALALPMRLAAVWILSAGGLHVVAAMLNQSGEWTTLGAYMTAGKLFILLIIGALALAFSEQIRREERSRQATEEHATKLAALNEQLQQFEQTRQSFLSAIAHELRTPLTVLKTLFPTTNDWDRMPVERRQEIQTMVEQNLNRLESLVSDYLEATRLEAGAVTLHRQPLSLARRVLQVVNILNPLFQSKQQQVKIDISPSLPRIEADQRRLDQILSCLLHNAYKFTPVGGMVHVFAQVTGDAVQVCVEDNGPGIPPVAQDHIFDKFYSASAESGLAGVGLGLFICRQLVLLHSGEIWYQERSGGGSVFCFTLPLFKEEEDGDSN